MRAGARSIPCVPTEPRASLCRCRARECRVMLGESQKKYCGIQRPVRCLSPCPEQTPREAGADSPHLLHFGLRSSARACVSRTPRSRDRRLLRDKRCSKPSRRAWGSAHSEGAGREGRCSRASIPLPYPTANWQWSMSGLPGTSHTTGKLADPEQARPKQGPPEADRITIPNRLTNC
jgi:hypothetical protein